MTSQTDTQHWCHSVRQWLPLAVLAVAMTTALLPGCHGAICEPVRIPMCQWLPYNLTRMPNLLYHSTQKNAILVIEQYQPLVLTNCSASLLFFLCTMFTPMCPMGFRQDVIPPCKGVCQKARRGCEPILKQYNLTWPKDLRCDNLPMYNNGVCISPESIVTSLQADGVTVPHDTSLEPMWNPQPPPQTYPIQPPSRPRACRCERTPSQSLRKQYLEKKYDYAIRGVFRGATKWPDGSAVITVQTQKVLKRRRVRVREGRPTRLWAPAGCICPALRWDTSFLFLGYEDPKRGRLLLTGDSHTEPWRNRVEGRIQKWEEKLKEQRRRKRKRSSGGLKDAEDDDKKQEKKSKRKNKDRRGRKKKDRGSSRREGRGEGRGEAGADVKGEGEGGGHPDLKQSSESRGVDPPDTTPTHHHQ